MDLLVCYDISTVTLQGEYRLGRVAKVCERYGTRVQKSVFEMRLSETGLERLLNALADEIDPVQDTVLVYRIRGALVDARISLGREVDHEPGDPWIF